MEQISDLLFVIYTFPDGGRSCSVLSKLYYRGGAIVRPTSSSRRCLGCTGHTSFITHYGSRLGHISILSCVIVRLCGNEEIKWVSFGCGHRRRSPFDEAARYKIRFVFFVLLVGHDAEQVDWAKFLSTRSAIELGEHSSGWIIVLACKSIQTRTYSRAHSWGTFQFVREETKVVSGSICVRFHRQIYRTLFIYVYSIYTSYSMHNITLKIHHALYACTFSCGRVHLQYIIVYEDGSIWRHAMFVYEKKLWTPKRWLHFRKGIANTVGKFRSRHAFGVQ